MKFEKIYKRLSKRKMLVVIYGTYKGFISSREIEFYKLKSGNFVGWKARIPLEDVIESSKRMLKTNLEVAINKKDNK